MPTGRGAGGFSGPDSEIKTSSPEVSSGQKLWKGGPSNKFVPRELEFTLDGRGMTCIALQVPIGVSYVTKTSRPWERGRMESCKPYSILPSRKWHPLPRTWSQIASQWMLTNSNSRSFHVHTSPPHSPSFRQLSPSFRFLASPER